MKTSLSNSQIPRFCKNSTLRPLYTQPKSIYFFLQKIKIQKYKDKLENKNLKDKIKNFRKKLKK